MLSFVEDIASPAFQIAHLEGSVPWTILREFPGLGFGVVELVCGKNHTYTSRPGFESLRHPLILKLYEQSGSLLKKHGVSRWLQNYPVVAAVPPVATRAECRASNLRACGTTAVSKERLESSLFGRQA